MITAGTITSSLKQIGIKLGHPYSKIKLDGFVLKSRHPALEFHGGRMIWSGMFEPVAFAV
jgi:hypothetical protein